MTVEWLGRHVGSDTTTANSGRRWVRLPWTGMDALPQREMLMPGRR